jgi:hypothetical protein
MDRIEQEIAINYPDAKIIIDLEKGYSLTFDGCGFICPDIIIARRIPNNRLKFILDYKEMMHDNSLLIAQTIQSDLDFVIKDAGMALIRVFKEGLNFVYIIKK